VIGVSSRRSKVVNRSLQLKHSRRRLMASLASVVRESVTLLSTEPQYGHLMGALYKIWIVW